MNVSFFQTYGNRLPLLIMKQKDINLQNFLNRFDLNIISLHNCTQDVKNFVKNNKISSRSIMFDLNGKNYCECIRFLFDYLKDKQIEKFFFYQDDTFSFEIDDHNEKDLYKIVFDNDFDMVNLFYKTDYLKNEKNLWNESETEIVLKSNDINLYATKTSDFKKSGLWEFDDSCFVANYKKMMEIFDEGYFKFDNIWTAETYLKEKYEKNHINRFITNKSFFKNYNILGPSANEKDYFDIKKRLNL